MGAICTKLFAYRTRDILLKKAARLRQSLSSGNNLSRRRCLGRFLSERPPDNKFLNVKMSHVAPWQNSGEVEEGMEHRGMEESGILN